MENKDLNLVKRYISNLLAISPAKFLIKESQGLYDPLIPISEEVVKQILSSIKPIVEKQGFFDGEIYIDTSKMDDPFFNSLKIRLQYIEEYVPLADISGVYDTDENIIKDGKIDVVIHISSIGQDRNFADKLRSTIIHELGHAYDDYMETLNSKYGKSYIRCESESVINREVLASCFIDLDSVKAKLASVVMFILKSEREAEQNQFIYEVLRLEKFRVMEEPKNMMKYVTKTDFYQNMINIQNRLIEIENLENIQDKIEVTQAFNSIYRSKNVSYEEMCKYLHKQWNQRKNELLKCVTKRLVDNTESFVENPVDMGRFIMGVYEKYGRI